MIFIKVKGIWVIAVNLFQNGILQEKIARGVLYFEIDGTIGRSGLCPDFTGFDVRKPDGFSRYEFQGY